MMNVDNTDAMNHHTELKLHRPSRQCQHTEVIKNAVEQLIFNRVKIARLITLIAR